MKHSRNLKLRVFTWQRAHAHRICRASSRCIVQPIVYQAAVSRTVGTAFERYASAPGWKVRFAASRPLYFADSAVWAAKSRESDVADFCAVALRPKCIWRLSSDNSKLAIKTH